MCAGAYPQDSSPQGPSGAGTPLPHCAAGQKEAEVEHALHKDEACSKKGKESAEDREKMTAARSKAKSLTPVMKAAQEAARSTSRISMDHVQAATSSIASGSRDHAQDPVPKQNPDAKPGGAHRDFDSTKGYPGEGPTGTSTQGMTRQYTSSVPAAVAQQSTSKVPPYWDTSLELRGYPFRIWRRDVEVWCAGTELSERQQGPALVQQLGGTCRRLAQEIGVDVLTQGRWDQAGKQTHTGVQVLLEGLTRRYAALDVEADVMRLIELITFKRKPWETIDDAFSRFETTHNRANAMPQFDMPTTALAWLLLEALHIPRDGWSLLSCVTGGQPPITAAQLQDLMTSIRQQGHFAEHSQDGPSTSSEGMKGDTGLPGKDRNPQCHGTEDRQEDDELDDNPWSELDNDDPWSRFGSYLGGRDHGKGSARQEGEQDESEEVSATHEEDRPCCSHRQSDFNEEVDDNFNVYAGIITLVNDTDTESEMDTEGMSAEEAEYCYYGPYGKEETYESLKEAYLVHKKRFRRFARRGPRRYRSPEHTGNVSFKGRKGCKGKDHDGKGGSSKSSVVSPLSLAKGKGKSQGKKSFSKGPGLFTLENPRGTDGKIMRCHGCGSAQHLISRCPSREGKGKGGKQIHLMEYIGQGEFRGL